MLRLHLSLVVLSAFTATNALAGPLKMSGDERRAAAAALDKRLNCAVYYKFSAGVIRKRPATMPAVQMAQSFDAAGNNMLVQVGVIGESLGADAVILNQKYRAAFMTLQAKVSDRLENYNRVARQMHEVCTSLLR